MLLTARSSWSDDERNLLVVVSESLKAKAWFRSCGCLTRECLLAVSAAA
eukprot:XP_001705067.1 Hypothetical protein GL50803_39514 [Giardia lamblia ATCC 50803]